MAEHGWNLRHRNMQHGLTNHARHDQPFHNPTSQIACRLCDHVFLSTQALINHIESHIAEEESTAASRSRQHRATSRLPSQRDLLFNCSQPNFATLPENRLPLVQPPAAAAERHPFLCVHRTFAPPTPTLLPQVYPMGRFSSHAPQLILSGPQGQRRAAEEPPGDCTKPYLDQLEHPIMAIVQVADRNDENNGISGLNKLDLALKL